MKLYSSTSISSLIGNYLERGGELSQISEGSLGHGNLILTGLGLKTAVIKEVFINHWASGHTVRFYNDTPLKYKEDDDDKDQ